MHRVIAYFLDSLPTGNSALSRKFTVPDKFALPRSEWIFTASGKGALPRKIMDALPRKMMDALPRRLMHYHKGGYTTTEQNNDSSFTLEKEVKIQRKNFEERKAKETTRKTSLSTECK
ncbi:2214_t:CDS:2 [Ambispora gerdemannii]|uniref:2214_t:CDS:1 n=1 Tax=Ambispora gerdemannii TaxID=144530 RepID=A0A9N9AUS7_9GLOM|nr:2214_t:CDS:2 [Ambispora gerdemannii]